MEKFLQIVRSVGRVIFGIAAGLFLGSYLIRLHEWHPSSLFLLAWGSYIVAILMIQARTKKERTERMTEAVRKFRIREERFGLRAVTLLRAFGIGLLILGLAVILIAGLFSYTSHAIFPIAGCLILAGLLIAAPFCDPASRAFRHREEKDRNKATGVSVK